MKNKKVFDNQLTMSYMPEDSLQIIRNKDGQLPSDQSQKSSLKDIVKLILGVTYFIVLSLAVIKLII